MTLFVYFLWRKKKPFHITRAVPLDAIPGNFLKASLAPLLWIIAQYIPQESHKNVSSSQDFYTTMRMMMTTTTMRAITMLN
jgi:hypothetical protein